MRRAAAWLALIALAAGAVLWLGGGVGAASSSLSRGPRGWMAARAYLEARGTRVDLVDAPLTAAAGGEVLVLAFPWQQAVHGGETEALGGFLRRGGTVVLGYSGEIGDDREARVLDALGLELTELRPAPPLAPRRWWRYHRESWTLAPAAAWPGGPVLELPALRGAPEAPDAARVLHRLADGPAVVFDFPRHRGRVVALPAAVWSNAWIEAAGNVDLLESLRVRLGDAWRFDEYHHGLVGVDSIPESTSRFAWDLFVVHLALIYGLGLAALARRFGPAWREAPVAAGSTAAFLRHLGGLHRELGHHGAAARLLVERARAHDPGLSLPDDVERRLPRIDGDAELVELARAVSRSQRRKR